MKRAAILLLAALSGGCALTAPPPAVVPQQLFADAQFGAPSEEIDTSRLFDLSPAMRDYLRSPRFREMVRNRGAQRGLVDALYNEGELRLDYDATATRPAASTFELKSGNCLSLVIMTAALARGLDMAVTFQEVRVGETWSRMGSLYTASGHVNIVLGGRSVAGAADMRESLVVDFLSQEDAAKQRSVALEEATIVAMYANNRAAEALAANRVADAYWWARKALEVEPGLAIAYNTLGAVYQVRGDNLMAERAFRAVLARERDSVIAMQNLAPVLEAQGKTREARDMRARLAALDPEPPYHYFRAGVDAMRNAEYRLARDMFRREVERAPYSDQFHYWLGLAHLQLGDTGAAREQMALAVENSVSRGSRDAYSSKLQRLKAMHGRAL
ncbi:MAG TPA: hypothetical protein VGE60_06240 [Telluria sp.]